MACFGMCPAVFSPWSFDGPHLFPLLFLVLPMNWFTFPLLFQLIWAWHLAFCLTFLAQKVGASFSGSRVSRRLKIENCSLARYGYFFVLFCFVLFFFFMLFSNQEKRVICGVKVSIEAYCSCFYRPFPIGSCRPLPPSFLGRYILSMSAFGWCILCKVSNFLDFLVCLSDLFHFQSMILKL